MLISMIYLFATSFLFFVWSRLSTKLYSSIIIIILWDFFTPALSHGFSLESELLKVSRTLLSIPADLKNAVVSMASIHPPTSYCSSSLTKPFRIVPGAPIIIDITVTFMFSSKVRVPLLNFFFSFLLCGPPKHQSPLVH